MFGRGVAVLLRFPAPARRSRTTPFQCPNDLTVRILLTHPRRHYATPGRPRKAVGEPSRPVKRAVKRAAPRATSEEDSPAKEKIERKKKDAAAKKKKTPAAKKTRARKELTEEQQAAKAAKLEKAKISDLKKAALKPPTVKKANAMLVFMGERSGELKGSGHSSSENRERLGEHTRRVAAAYKDLSTAELEHYNHLAHTAKDESQAEYKRWVESHTPEQIAFANRARRMLRRKVPGPSRQVKYAWPLINDERAAKPALSAYLQFSINRMSSPDFRNIKISERAKLIGQEWKALNDSEKAKYKSLQEEDSKRYVDEYSHTFGHPPPSFNNGAHQPQAAAAAA